MSTVSHRWELDARMALARRGVDRREVDALLAGLGDLHSGHSLHEEFGSPDEFAAIAVAERTGGPLPAVDDSGWTVSDHLCGAAWSVVVLGLFAVAFYSVVGERSTLALSTAAVWGWTFVAFAQVVVIGVPSALRAAGAPRLAPWGFVLVALLIVAGTWSFRVLPATPAVEFPVIVVMAVGVGALWLLTRSPNPVRGGRPGPAARSDERWFRHLTGLLVGRHDLSRADAAALAAESRSHVAAAGTTPPDEFGPVGEYARELARSRSARRRPWWRHEVLGRWFGLLATLIWVAVAVEWFGQGQVWGACLVVGGLVVVLGGWLCRVFRLPSRCHRGRN